MVPTCTSIQHPAPPRSLEAPGGSCITDKAKMFFGAEIFVLVANVILMLISCGACCRRPARIRQIQAPVDQGKDTDDEAVTEVYCSTVCMLCVREAHTGEEEGHRRGDGAQVDRGIR